MTRKIKNNDEALIARLERRYKSILSKFKVEATNELIDLDLLDYYVGETEGSVIYKASEEEMDSYSQEVIKKLEKRVEDEVADEGSILNKVIILAFILGASEKGSELKKNIKSADKAEDDFYKSIGGVNTNPVRDNMDKSIKKYEVDAIKKRSFDKLKGVTKEMQASIKAVLVTGVREGTDPKVLARKLSEQFSEVPLYKFERIARTEVTYSKHKGSLTEGVILQKNIGKKIWYKWTSVGDSRVREKHRFLNGKVLNRINAERYTGEPNCRCSITPISEDDVRKNKLKYYNP